MSDPTYYAEQIFGPADGSQTVWDFAFTGIDPDDPASATYLSPADVHVQEVTPSGVATERTFTFVTASSVSVVPPIAAGNNIRIYRSTPVADAIVNFQDKQVVQEKDLDSNNRQLFYVVQEARDAATHAITDSAQAVADSAEALDKANQAIDATSADVIEQINEAVVEAEAAAAAAVVTKGECEVIRDECQEILDEVIDAGGGGGGDGVRSVAGSTHFSIADYVADPSGIVEHLPALGFVNSQGDRVQNASVTTPAALVGATTYSFHFRMDYFAITNRVDSNRIVFQPDANSMLGALRLEASNSAAVSLDAAGTTWASTGAFGFFFLQEASVVITVNAAAGGTVSLYQDGVLRASGTNASARTMGATMDCSLGFHGVGSTNGKYSMRDVGVWHSILSSGDIAALATAHPDAVSPSTLDLYWPCDEGAGSTATDDKAGVVLSMANDQPGTAPAWVTLDGAPTAPVDGQVVLIQPNATGAFAGHDNNIAIYKLADTSWTFYPPANGWWARIIQYNLDAQFDGTNWVQDVATQALTQVQSKAPLASPALTGTPTAPTAATGTNTTQIATTAFVGAAIAALPASAPVNSPTFTGDPKAPTPAVDDADTSIATTAWVNGQLSNVTPVADSTSGTAGVAVKIARSDHAHPTDTSRAPLASPALTGNPTAPTQTAGDNSTKLATTAFVTTAVANAGPSDVVFGFAEGYLNATDITAGVPVVWTSVKYDPKAAFPSINSSTITIPAALNGKTITIRCMLSAAENAGASEAELSANNKPQKVLVVHTRGGVTRKYRASGVQGYTRSGKVVSSDAIAVQTGDTIQVTVYADVTSSVGLSANSYLHLAVLGAPGGGSGSGGGVMSVLPSGTMFMATELSYGVGTNVTGSTSTPLKFQLMDIDSTVTVTGIRCNVGAAAAVNINVAIHEFLGNGLPGKALGNVNVDASTTGVKTVNFGTALTLPPGKYFLVTRNNNTTAGITGFSTSNNVQDSNDWAYLVSDPFVWLAGGTEVDTCLAAETAMVGGTWTAGKDLTGTNLTSSNTTGSLSRAMIGLMKQ